MAPRSVPNITASRRARNDALVGQDIKAEPWRRLEREGAKRQSQFAGMARQNIAKAQRRMWNDGEAALNRIFIELDDEARRTNDFEGMPERFEEVAANRVATLLGEQTDGDVQEMLRVAGERNIASLRGRTNQRAFQLESEASLGALNFALETDMELFRRCAPGDDACRLDARARAIGRIDREEFADAATSSRMRSTIAATAADEYVRQLILSAGTPDGISQEDAEAAVKDDKHPIMGVLSDRDRVAALGSIGTAYKGVRDAAVAQARQGLANHRANLNRVIAEASPEDIPRLRARIEAMEFGEDQVLRTEDQKVSAQARLDDREQRLEQQSISQAEVFSAMAGVGNLVVESPQADEAANAILGPQLEMLDELRAEPGTDAALVSRGYAEIGLQVAGLGWVPSDLDGRIKAGFGSNRAEHVMDALMLVRGLDMQPRNGPLLSRAYESGDLRMETILSRTNAGSTPERAIEEADQAIAQSVELRGAREKEWRDDERYDDTVTELVRTLEDPFGPDFLRHGDFAELPGEAVAEFTANARRLYLLNGDYEGAVNAAKKGFIRKWYPTTVGTGGERRWQPAPPEAFFPNMEAADIEEQLLVDVAPLTQNPERIRLLPTPMSTRAALPSWMVVEIDEDGATSALRDEKGGPVFFRPNAATSPALARSEEAMAVRLDEARATVAEFEKDPGQFHPLRFAGQLD